MSKSYIRSIYGTKEKDFGALKTVDGIGGIQRESPEECWVRLYSKTFYLGESAEKVTVNPFSSMADDHFNDPEQFMPAAIYSILETRKDEIDPVNLIIALPISVMMDLQRAEGIKHSITKMLSDDFLYFWPKGTGHLKIGSIDFTAQGLASFYAQVFSDEGKCVLSTDLLSAATEICDIGYGTLDLFCVENGEIQLDSTAGYPLGLKYAMQELQTMIYRESSFQPSIKVTMSYLLGEKDYILLKGCKFDIREMREQAIQMWVKHLETKLGRHLENGNNFAQIIFTGGGVQLISEQLLQRFPFGVVSVDPIFSNAIGCYRLGRYQQRENVIGLDPGFFAFKAYSGADESASSNS